MLAGALCAADGLRLASGSGGSGYHVRPRGGGVSCAGRRRTARFATEERVSGVTDALPAVDRAGKAAGKAADQRAKEEDAILMWRQALSARAAGSAAAVEPAVYARAIAAFGRKGQADAANAVFWDAVEEDSASTHVYTAAIAAQNRAQNIGKCYEIADLLLSAPAAQLDAAAVTAVLQFMARSGDARGAQRVLRIAEGAAVSMDAFAHAAAVRALASGRRRGGGWKQAAAYAERAWSGAAGAEQREALRGALLLAASFASQSKRGDVALRLLRKVQRHDAPSGCAARASEVEEAMMRALLRAGDPRAAVDLFKDANLGRAAPPSDGMLSCGAMAAGLCGDAALSRSLLNRMSSPSGEAVRGFLRGCGRRGLGADVVSVAWQHTLRRSIGGEWPKVSVHEHAAHLRALGDAGAAPEAVVAAYEAAVRGGAGEREPRGLEALYAALVESLSALGDAKGAHRFAREASTKGVELSTSAADALLECSARAAVACGDAEEARRHVALLVDAFNAMVKGTLTQRPTRRACRGVLDALDELRRRGGDALQEQEMQMAMRRTFEAALHTDCYRVRWRDEGGKRGISVNLKGLGPAEAACLADVLLSAAQAERPLHPKLLAAMDAAAAGGRPLALYAPREAKDDAQWQAMTVAVRRSLREVEHRWRVREVRVQSGVLFLARRRRGEA